MNKKFTKAAALSIAAVTALSAMALPVSADVVLKDNNVTNQKEMSGSAINAKWELRYTEVQYTATISGTDDYISVQFGASSVATVPATAPDGMNWDRWNATTYKSNNISGKYYTTTSAANVPINELKKVATYQNQTAALAPAETIVNDYKDTTLTTAVQKQGGTTEFANWKNAFNNFVKVYNDYHAKKKAYDKACADFSAGRTTINPNAAGNFETYQWTNGAGEKVDITTALDDTPTSFSGKTTYTLRTYSLDSSVTSVAIQAILDADVLNYNSADVATAVGYGNGVITFSDSGEYKLVGGSSSTTDSTTDTWYPSLESERTVYSSVSYKGNNGFWYTSAALAEKYGLGYSGISSGNNWSSYSSATSTVYFDAYNGTYNTAGGAYCYAVKAKSDSFYSASLGSYLAADGLYYPSVTEAKNASYSYNGSTSCTTIATAATARYFSIKTGKFYDSYSDALKASPSSSYVVDLASYKAPVAYDYYPYYYYNTSSGKNSGTAYIYNSKKVAGWTSIKNYVAYKSKGSAVSIAMNKDTTVPKNIFTAAKSKNVTLQFINSNGSAVVIKGSSITEASDTNVAVSYNAKVIPTSLKNKAKKANKDVVSTAQVKIGDNGALGATADVTVKLPAKRSGCTVKAYRYTSSGSLKLVDTAKVAKNGEVTITTDNGGYFLLVVCD